MDFKRIEIFCRIVDLKSFTRAAEEIHLSQPTVSEHLRLLEEELGERLLERSGRSISLTPAGKTFHPYARRILQLAEEAKQALSRFRGSFSGNLIIGASTIPGAYYLPTRLQSFKQQHPDINLSLKISSTHQTLSDLLSGKLELALIGATNNHAQLEQIPLLPDELVLVVNPRHPWAEQSILEPELLLEQPFILREEGSGSRHTMFEALQSLGIHRTQLQVIAEMSNNESIRQSVKAGIGAAILSRSVVAEDLAAGALTICSVKGLSISRHIYLAHHRNRARSPLAETFCQHLLKQNNA